MTQPSRPEDDGPGPGAPETSEPAQGPDPNLPQHSADEESEDCDEPEVVAHADQGGEPPWCIGYAQ